MFEDNGIHACFSCASDAMAESYSHRPFGRSPAITDALRRQAAWAQRRATVDSATAPPLPAISAARASRQQHHPHGLLAAKLVGRLLLHSEQLAVIAEVMSDASQPDRPLVAWLLSADRVLDPERDVPSQCRPMPLAEAEAAADAYEKTADECDASARAADLLGSMVPAPRGSAAGSQLGGDDMDGIDDSANAAPDDDITGGAGSEAQAQNTAAAGGDRVCDSTLQHQSAKRGRCSHTRRGVTTLVFTRPEEVLKQCSHGVHTPHTVNMTRVNPPSVYSAARMVCYDRSTRQRAWCAS